MRGDVLTATKTDGSKITARKESNLSALETLKLFGAPAEALTNLPIVVEDPSCRCRPGQHLVHFGDFGFNYLFHFSQLAAAPRQWLRLQFQQYGAQQPRIISNTNDKDRQIKSRSSQVTFQDVAGVEQAKLELQEIIEFLKEPAKFAKLGARIPKGVLMAGHPAPAKLPGQSRSRRSGRALLQHLRLRICRNVCRCWRGPGARFVQAGQRAGPGRYLCG